ncbi:uncharacterized protein si:dkey-10c21.1 isoform X1 [Onychostoma macrolepis]|uniref:CARD domain-containing protein n=1 Tax=Onychostoma macrolepis TaxID=369639 RepID=A0A7J6CN90_9TELE|nr:uncharacterized protein si:dkey-10c21.1 isoform X1 [Onychostoma macrolepis]KAF4108799.1 hypothetical protein G5714_009872 [Onychostoma macrolepis]
MEEIVLQNKPKLIKWLSLDHIIVLQHVQAKKLITMSQYRDLKEMKAKDRVIQLLDIILERGENACRDFLYLLKEDDVNEISPELSDWIKTVDTEDQKTEKDKGRECLNRPIQETTNMTEQSGIQVTCKNSASGGGSIIAPVITGGNLSSFEMNTTVAPSGRQVVQTNYQKSDRDCEHRPIQDYQRFLKENTSKLIQKVKNFDPIIDDLDLHDELVANVRAKPTDQEKMRKLLTCVNCESIAKDLFNALCEHEKRLMNELLKRY